MGKRAPGQAGHFRPPGLGVGADTMEGELPGHSQLFLFSGLCRSWGEVLFSHSVVSDSLQPHRLQHARPPCPSPTPTLLKLMSIESMMPSNHLILCHPLLLLPSIFPSNRVFPNESVLDKSWPKYFSFRFRFSPSNEYSGLISFSHLKAKRHLRVFTNSTD